MSDSLIYVLLKGVLWVDWLSLGLNLLLVLLVHRLVVNIASLGVGSLISVWLDRCWNLLVKNTRKNILLLLRDSLWDISSDVVLLIKIGGVILVFR